MNEWMNVWQPAFSTTNPSRNENKQWNSLVVADWVFSLHLNRNVIVSIRCTIWRLRSGQWLSRGSQWTTHKERQLAVSQVPRKSLSVTNYLEASHSWTVRVFIEGSCDVALPSKPYSVYLNTPERFVLVQIIWWAFQGWQCTEIIDENGQHQL